MRMKLGFFVFNLFKFGFIFCRIVYLHLLFSINCFVIKVGHCFWFATVTCVNKLRRRCCNNFTMHFLRGVRIAHGLREVEGFRWLLHTLGCAVALLWLDTSGRMCLLQMLSSFTKYFHCYVKRKEEYWLWGFQRLELREVRRHQGAACSGWFLNRFAAAIVVVSGDVSKANFLNPRSKLS